MNEQHKTEDYLPQDDGALGTWTGHFKTEVAKPINSGAMGWDATEVSDLTEASDMVLSGLAEKESARQSYLAAIAGAQAKIATGLATIRNRVAEGKELDSASDSIQQALGVKGEVITLNPETYQAELRGVVAAGPAQVTVKFGKARGLIQAVRVYMRRGGGPWMAVGFAMRSPWTDITPLAVPGQPEQREYRIRAIIDDQEIGQFSSILPLPVT